jgi:hypothetical protein
MYHFQGNRKKPLSSSTVQSSEERRKSGKRAKFTRGFLLSLDKSLNPIIMRAIEQGMIEARPTSVAPALRDGNCSGVKGDAAEGYRLFRAGMPGTRENILCTVASAESCQTHGETRTQTVMNRLSLVHDLFCLEENCMAGTFWALVPPIVAIVLALITKETYSSLFIGIVVGSLFVGGFNLVDSLDTMIDMLAPGGRLCIITFHSLEDRIVKNAFRRNEKPCTCPPEFPVCVCGKVSKGRVVTRKPILPGREELDQNRRSASAKLRIFERAPED